MKEKTKSWIDDMLDVKFYRFLTSSNRNKNFKISLLEISKNGEKDVLMKKIEIIHKSNHFL